MAAKKSLGEKISMLAKSRELSQTELADRLGIAHSQVNRFFRGHSELNSSNLNLVLRELGIDLEEIVSKKIRKHADIEDGAIETAADCVNYLFKNLDDHGRQAYLNQLAWAARAISKEKLPVRVEEVVKRELNLI